MSNANIFNKLLNERDQDTKINAKYLTPGNVVWLKPFEKDVFTTAAVEIKSVNDDIFTGEIIDQTTNWGKDGGETDPYFTIGEEVDFCEEDIEAHANESVEDYWLTNRPEPRDWLDEDPYDLWGDRDPFEENTKITKQRLTEARGKREAQMIQEHMLDFYEGDYDMLLDEIESAYKRKGYQGLKELVTGGTFFCYWHQAEEFLNEVFNSDKDRAYQTKKSKRDDWQQTVWDRYCNLLAMECANIRQNPNGGGRNYLKSKPKVRSDKQLFHDMINEEFPTEVFDDILND